MKFRTISFSLAAIPLVLSVPMRTAHADTDAARLQTEQQRIDQDRAETLDAQRVNALAKEFKVPASAVEDLNAKGLGKGEITIALAEAREMAKTNPTAYPTTAAALNKVEALRAAGEGWGKIAKDQGFKLGPVVSAAHHVRHEVFASARPGPTAIEHPERPEPTAVETPERPEHAERLEHADRPEPMERPGAR